ncbi:MAG: CoA-binding protein [Planctomycetaceae bacterium]|nr:CoA-binding protein [Planctomycetaceae bacterium]
MSQPTVAIIGASADRQKYGNKSVRAHLKQGYEVFPVHPSETNIEGLTVYRSLADIPVAHLNRISVYVPPQIGIGLLEEIQAKGADEVWFNPGSESPELLQRAGELGLNIIQACSIIDIGESPSAHPG